MSRRTLSSPFLLTLVALAALFLVAYALDFLLTFLVNYAGQTFAFLPAAIAKATLPFVIVALVLAFAWLVLIRLPPRTSIAATVLVTGLLLTAIYLPFPFFSLPEWLIRTPVGALRAKLWSLEGYSSFYYLAAACVVIGVVGVLRSRKEWPES